MLDTIPTEEEMIVLIGKSLYDVWNKLCLAMVEKRAGELERLICASSTLNI